MPNVHQDRLIVSKQSLTWIRWNQLKTTARSVLFVLGLIDDLTGAIVIAIEGSECVFAEIFCFATRVKLFINWDKSIFRQFTVGTRRTRQASSEQQRSMCIFIYQSRKKPACHSRICSSVKFVFALSIWIALGVRIVLDGTKVDAIVVSKRSLTDQLWSTIYYPFSVEGNDPTLEDRRSHRTGAYVHSFLSLTNLCPTTIKMKRGKKTRCQSLILYILLYLALRFYFSLSLCSTELLFAGNFFREPRHWQIDVSIFDERTKLSSVHARRSKR